jgi:hypothetical protein
VARGDRTSRSLEKWLPGDPFGPMQDRQALLRETGPLGSTRSDPLPDPQLIKQAAPLLAVLVVAHSLGDELDSDQIEEPHVRGLVDDLAIDLRPELASLGRIVELHLGRAFDPPGA